MISIQKITCLSILLLLVGTVSHAEIRHFSQKVDQPFSGSQSPDDARIAALTKAKMEALEKAGTYIETLTVVENFRLKKDEITAFASGIVRSEILSQENYATPNGFGILLVVQLEIDSSLFQERIQKMANDRTLLEKYNEIQQREKELLEVIRNLEKQNQALQQKDLPAASIQKGTFEESYNRTIKALSAAEWNRKAIRFWQNGAFTDPHQAISYLNHSIRLDQNNPQAFNNRGSAYYQLGRLDLSIQDFNTAIQMDNSYPAAFNNRGIAYYHLKNYEKAIESFDQAVRLQPENVKPYLFRGAAHKNLYQYQQAFNDFSKVRILSPDVQTNAEQPDSVFLELNELERICTNAQKACNLGLCRAMTYLHEKGFCSP